MTLAPAIIYRGHRFSLVVSHQNTADPAYLKGPFTVVWRDGAVNYPEALWYEFTYSEHCRPQDTVSIYVGTGCCTAPLETQKEKK